MQKNPGKFSPPSTGVRFCKAGGTNISVLPPKKQKGPLLMLLLLLTPIAAVPAQLQVPLTRMKPLSRGSRPPQTPTSYERGPAPSSPRRRRFEWTLRHGTVGSGGRTAYPTPPLYIPRSSTSCVQYMPCISEHNGRSRERKRTGGVGGCLAFLVRRPPHPPAPPRTPSTRSPIWIRRRSERSSFPRRLWRDFGERSRPLGKRETTHEGRKVAEGGGARKYSWSSVPK